MVRHRGKGDEDLLKGAWTTVLILVLAGYIIIGVTRSGER